MLMGFKGRLPTWTMNQNTQMTRINVPTNVGAIFPMNLFFIYICSPATPASSSLEADGAPVWKPLDSWSDRDLWLDILPTWALKQLTPKLRSIISVSASKLRFYAFPNCTRSNIQSHEFVCDHFQTGKWQNVFMRHLLSMSSLRNTFAIYSMILVVIPYPRPHVSTSSISSSISVRPPKTGIYD